MKDQEEPGEDAVSFHLNFFNCVGSNNFNVLITNTVHDLKFVISESAKENNRKTLVCSCDLVFY